MMKNSEHKKTIIIVPGLAESAAHFKKMKKLLERHNFIVTIVPSWNVKKLNRDSADMFIGHSLGANLLLRKRLSPALLVGTADATKIKKHVIRSLLAADVDALKNKKILRHFWHRVNNAWTVIVHFPQFLTLIREYRNIDFFHYQPDSAVVIIQNSSDYIVQTADCAHTQLGTHEDFVLRPENYIDCIIELSKK